MTAAMRYPNDQSKFLVILSSRGATGTGSNGKQQSGLDQVRPALKTTQSPVRWSQDSLGPFFLGPAHWICSGLDSLSFSPVPR